LSPDQALNTTPGDFNSLLACEAIYNGVARVKKKKLSFFEVLALK
jgi:hypothetical protein